MKYLALRWRLITGQWPVLTLYQRFESVIGFALTLIVTMVILVALFRLIVDIVGALVLGAVNPLEPTVFQTVLGEIMTLLIALEFNHTLHYFVARSRASFRRKSSC